MIRVTLEPTQLVVDQPNDLTIQLTNIGRGLCTNVVFKLTLPVQVVLLQGLDRIEVAQLDAGQSITHTVRVRPKLAGTWALSSTNFSYRDALGQSRRITDLHLEVTVVPMVPAPVMPEPELVVTLHTAELPLREWKMLEGRVVNIGRPALQQVAVRTVGPVTCDPSNPWQTLGALPPGEAAEFHIPVRADESGSEVPVRIEVSYTDIVGRTGRREQLTPVRVSALASRPEPIRLEHLADNIGQDLALLKEYEDALRYEDDPRRQAKYRREIEKVRESGTRYQQEYDKLRLQVSGKPPAAMQKVGAQLEQMDAKLDALLAKQATIHGDLDALRATLLTRYDLGERAVVTAVIEHLDRAQMETTQAVLDALDTGRVPEAQLQVTLAAVQQALAELQQRVAELPNLALNPGLALAAETVAAPTLDVKHKLKVTAPIIPLILSYEGEVELTSGLNLKAIWQQLVARVRGR